MQLPWRYRLAPPVEGRSATPARRWPTAVSCLLAAQVLGYLAQLTCRLLSANGTDRLLTAGALSAHGLRAGNYWQPLTHLFLTGDAFWLLPASLLALSLAGQPLEALLGRRHIFQLYFLSGAVGGLGQLGYDHLRANPATTLAGASAPALAFCLAAACILPDATPTPWCRLKVKHLAFGVLALLGLGLLAGDAASRRVPGLEIVGCLLGALTGCVYLRGLGFGQRERVLAPAAPASSAGHRPPPPAWASRRSAPSGVLTAPPPAATSAGARLAPRFTARERRMTPREYVTEKIDPILDKILLHGFGSLTTGEQRTLEKGRDKLTAPRNP